MKLPNFLITLLLALSLFALPACQTTGGKKVDVITIAASTATAAYIAEAKTAEKRTQRADQAEAIADALDSLSGDNPSSADLIEVVFSILGSDDPRAGIYMSALGALFDSTVSVDSQKENIQLLAKALHRTAARYKTPEPPLPQ